MRVIRRTRFPKPRGRGFWVIHPLFRIDSKGVALAVHYRDTGRKVDLRTPGLARIGSQLVPPIARPLERLLSSLHEHWHWLWHHPFSELFASAGELLHDSLADSNLHGHRPAISRKQPPLVGSDMSQHSDPISALSNHLASPALLTSNGPLGAVWPFENGVVWLKATLDSFATPSMGVQWALLSPRCHWSFLRFGSDLFAVSIRSTHHSTD